MINLLPPEVKSSYHYARRNVGLRRWVVIFIVSFVGLAALGTYGLLTLQQQTVTINKKITSSETLFQKEKFATTQKQVADISNSFKLVVNVLKQEVLFSELLKQMGRAMPTNSKLTGLTIVQTRGAIGITAIATDYKTATQVQVNLADPANKIFNKADIVGINCGTANALNPKYPCTINIQALFGDNNPFLFINDGGKKQ